MALEAGWRGVGSAFSTVRAGGWLERGRTVLALLSQHGRLSVKLGEGRRI